MKEDLFKRVRYVSKLRQRSRLLFGFVIFDLILSLSVAAMAIVTSSKTELTFLRYLLGVLFWLGAIGMILTASFINIRRKNSSSFEKAHRGKKKLGLIHFFQNYYATIADIFMFASILFVIILELLDGKQWVEMIVFSIFAFSFNMHCMLNGICYEYINYKVRREINHANSEKTVG